MALKILLADDNITAQKMGSKILTDAGYTVVAVSNGAAAMKKILSEKPELLMLDVYMPGYSGLEVCEKLKASAETTHIPVLLTVTNMEPFSAEDGNRVHADGVLVKPFEASDLLALVRQWEEKLHAPIASPANPDATQKIEAIKEFEDESYAEWKAEAEPEAEVQAVAMSQEAASVPALGLDHLESTPPADNAPVFAVQAPPVPFQIDSPPAFDVTAPAPAFGLADVDMRPSAEEPEIAPPAELEFTSVPQIRAAEVAPATELEVTSQEAAGDVPITQDAALVTDPSEITQFATKFGQENPEEIPVGIVIESPPEVTLETAEVAVETAEVAEPVPPEPPSPHWGDSEVRSALGFSGGAAAAFAPAREVEQEVGKDSAPLDVVVEAQPVIAAAIEEGSSPLAEAHTENSEATQKLVAQFAAELEAAQAVAPPEPEPPQLDMEPPAAAALSAAQPDEQQIAQAVSRVLERYKDELVAAIVRELKN